MSSHHITVELNPFIMVMNTLVQAAFIDCWSVLLLQDIAGKYEMPSAVTETIPEPETAVFCQNRWEPKPRFFWSQVNTVLPSDVCVYIWYKAIELVQVRRLKVPSKSSASAKFSHLIPERMLWKCTVSSSNHCEVDRQRLSTHDLFNAVIYSARGGRPWITGKVYAATAAAAHCDRQPGARK